MNINLATIITTLTLACTSLYGASYMKSHYIYSETYSNENINRIDSNGSVLVEGCTVKKHISVNGSLTIQDSTIEDITVNGEVSVSDSQVASALVNGAISGTNSQFTDLISVASENTLFNSCELNNLHIRKTGNPSGIQTVKLLGNTVVYKNISFEVPGGHVIVSKDTQIHGKVENGSVIYQ